MKPRKIDPEGKKERVISVARSLFVQKGFHNVTIPMIVRESGVSTGAIYSYFANKEQLASYIHQETLRKFQEQFDQRLQGKKTTYEQLRTFAELVFEITETDPEMMEYMLFMKHGEFMEDSPPICSTEPFLMVQGIVRDGLKRGDVKGEDGLLAAVSYTGVVLRASALRLQGVIPLPLTEVVDELVDNAWASICTRGLTEKS